MISISSVDENKDGLEDYTLGKPDFNVREFLSNLVLRWEFIPGMEPVKNYYTATGKLDLFDDVKVLFDRDNDVRHNVFLVKFNYRFGLR